MEHTTMFPEAPLRGCGKCGSNYADRLPHCPHCAFVSGIGLDEVMAVVDAAKRRLGIE